VKLLSPVNAAVNPPTAGWQGEIVDDDPAPTLSAADCTRVETNAGTVPCAFAVTLTHPSSLPIEVSYAIEADTAAADVDFQGSSGRMTFAPETSGRTLETAIVGDSVPEWNEAFRLTLSDPLNVTISDGEAIGTIIDDERTGFHTLTPCRLLDTRWAAGPSGGPALGAGSPRAFPVAGRCGVPPAANAVVVNVTAAAPTDAGNLRLYPTGLPMPNTSVLNFTSAAARANNATVLLGTSGQVTLGSDMSGAGQVHVVLDVFGYYQSRDAMPLKP